LLRLPNYVKYEPRPFDPDSYVDVKPEDDKSQEVAADRSLSTQMEISNTLRWRWVQRPDGNYVSNMVSPFDFSHHSKRPGSPIELSNHQMGRRLDEPAARKGTLRHLRQR